MTPSILQRRTRRGMPLWLEISVVLTVKLLLLGARKCCGSPNRWPGT